MKNSDSDMRNFTRGGQTLLHTMRMMNQIVNRISLFFLMFIAIFTLGMTYLSMTDYQFYILKSVLSAKMHLLFNKEAYQYFMDVNGYRYHVHSKAILESVFVKQQLQALFQLFLRYFLMSVFLSLAGILLVYRWLAKRGKDQTQTQSIRGDEIADLKRVKRKILKSAEGSNMNLAGLPMPNRFECRHVLVHGTTGSGKSVCIRELLDQIRKRGDRAIIYDKSCSYVQSYYDAKKDIILNPLDDRTASWHLWNECRDSVDYDSLSAALIPMPTGSVDPFWVNAARIIFSAAARQMQTDSDRSMLKLLRALLTANLATMESFLRGTEAETLVSEKIEKTALSVKSVLATYLKSLRYVKDNKDDAFSIRKWIHDENQSNWLFISSLSDRHDTLKPLISMWLDLAINALMSLPPSETRRIWIILDELPTLQRLPYLPECFAESRKFGGCLVAGVQSISQLRKLYGHHAAEEISGLCNTRIFFREPSAETARWVSNELGTAELEEVKEGMSYGENAMRAGISMSSLQSNRLIVHPSDIMRLNNLEAYVRLPGRFPITKLTFTYKNKKPIADPYVPRSGYDQSVEDNADETNNSEINNTEHMEKIKKTEKTKITKKTKRNKKTEIDDVNLSVVLPD